MKILITGASGFVGGALVRRCRRLGWEVYATGRRALSEAGYYSHDLTSPLRIPFRPDVVVHAAARSSPWGSDGEFRRQNVDATKNVLNFCAQNGLPQVVLISTSAVLYRREHQLELDENALPPPSPVNAYARTKLESEARVRGYPGAWTILRPRAVFGPGDTVVFPRILQAAQRGRLPRIEADQPAWSDLIYIDTLVEYIVRAIERRAVGLYHVTNHQPVALAEFLNEALRRLSLPLPTRRMSAEHAYRIATLLEAMHRTLPFLGEPPLTRFSVVAFAYSKTFSTQKTLRDLGAPCVPLGEGLDRFIAWQKPRL